MFLFFWTILVMYLTPIVLDAISRWIDREAYELSAWIWPYVTLQEIRDRLAD